MKAARKSVGSPVLLTITLLIAISVPVKSRFMSRALIPMMVIMQLPSEVATISVGEKACANP